MNQPYISSGNRKMSFPTWSLPAKRTCPGSTPQCRANCYACKAESAYPDVLPCRSRNLAVSRQDGFVVAMVVILGRRKSDYVRIHESGDFYSQAYLDKWIAICRALPGKTFLAFTKSFHLDYSDKPSNLVIVWSIWPDTDLTRVPAGPRAYAGDCGKVRAVECIGQCDACGICWKARGKFAVHFSIH